MNSFNGHKPERPNQLRIGEQFLKGGLINNDQLQQVLKRQSQVGGQLGSLFFEMGFVAIDDLLSFLGTKFDLPSVNLFNRSIDKEVLQLIPVEEMITKKIIPLEVDLNTISLAMINPQDLSTIAEIEFQLGKKVKPMVVPAFMLEAAVKNIKNSTNGNFIGEALAELVAMEKGEGSPKLISLLRYLVKTGASDMLICAGVPPSIKIGNQLKRLAIPALSPADCEKYARELLSPKAWEVFAQSNDYGFGVTYRDIGRLRITVFRQRNSVAIALRPIYDHVPHLEQLNLPEWVADFALRPNGMILVCGPAGHGKSTTLNAMVDIINSQRGCNILTLEDPIEYLHKHKKSNICQREIGRDTPSFPKGLRHIFRQAPDVIVIGEMRDRETFRIALQAANSGHLVLTTAHAENTTAIIERTINMFTPHEQGQIRIMLAESLILVLSQRLVVLSNRKGRILALEKFINTHRLRKFIREGKTHQIRSQLQSGADEYLSIDISLAELHNDGMIDYEDGLIYAEDKQFYRELIESPGLRVRSKTIRSHIDS